MVLAGAEVVVPERRHAVHRGMIAFEASRLPQRMQRSGEDETVVSLRRRRQERQSRSFTLMFAFRLHHEHEPKAVITRAVNTCVVGGAADTDGRVAESGD